jgi:hypothetical protein
MKQINGLLNLEDKLELRTIEKHHAIYQKGEQLGLSSTRWDLIRL